MRSAAASSTTMRRRFGPSGATPRRRTTASRRSCWASSRACRSRCAPHPSGGHLRPATPRTLTPDLRGPAYSEESTIMFITQDGAAPADVPARSGRHAGPAAARCDGAGAVGAGGHRREAGAPPRVRLRAERRHPWTSGRRRPTARDSSCRRPSSRSQPFRDQITGRSADLSQTTGRVVGDGNGDHARGTAVLAQRHPSEADGRRRRHGRHDHRPDRRRRARAARRGCRRWSWRWSSGAQPSAAATTATRASTCNTISWRTPTTPVPMENNPRIVFERLFGDGGNAAERLAQRAAGRTASSTRSSRNRRGCSARSAPADRDESRRIPRSGARGRAADPARRAADRRAHDADCPTGRSASPRASRSTRS